MMAGFKSPNHETMIYGNTKPIHDNDSYNGKSVTK